MAAPRKTYAYKSPAQLGKALVILLAAAGVLALLSGIATFSRMRGGPFQLIFDTTTDPATFASRGGGQSGSAADALDSLSAPVLLVTAIIWLIWQYRITANLWATNRPIKTTPGWAVGWWFVPVANLWMPAVSMYRAYRASVADPEERSALMMVWAWWGSRVVVPILLWVVGLSVFGPELARRFTDALDAVGPIPDNGRFKFLVDLTEVANRSAVLFLVNGVAGAVAAVFAILIVRKVTSAQERLSIAPDQASSPPTTAAAGGRLVSPPLPEPPPRLQ